VSFLSDFEDQITTTFNDVVAPTSAAVVTQFQPVFVAGFSIWILLIAYDVAWGKSEDGMTYLLTKIGKVFLIGTVALYGWPMLLELSIGLRDSFVVAVTCTTGGICGSTISSILEANLIDPLGAAWANLWDKVVHAFTPMDFIAFQFISKLFMIILTIVLYGVLTLCVGVLAVITLAMYLVSFATFSLLMCVGPFFLMCLAFPVVQRFFESWVGSTITASLAMAFTALMAILTSTALGLTDLAPLTEVGDLETYDLLLAFATKCGLCLLLVYLYYKVFDLAAALGGGMNLGNNMAGAMRNIARDAMRGPRQGRQGSTNSTGSNTLAQGQRSGSPDGGGNGGGNGSGSRRRPTLAETLAARQTFSGMAIAGGSHLTASAGRYAYNRGVAALHASVELLPKGRQPSSP